MNFGRPGTVSQIKCLIFRPASPASVLAFLLICGVVLAAFLRGIWISARSEGRDPHSSSLGTEL